jgi:hypothetical protein
VNTSRQQCVGPLIASAAANLSTMNPARVMIRSGLGVVRNLNSGRCVVRAIHLNRDERRDANVVPCAVRRGMAA